MSSHIIFSGELKAILFNISFIWRYFDFVVMFCFLNGHKVFDVIKIFCLILLFVFTRFLNIGVSRQSIAPSFTPPLSYLLWMLSFRSYTTFKKRYLSFWFSYVPHLVNNHAKIVDQRGRNLMCNCTLPSRLVFSILCVITKMLAAYNDK